MLLAGAAWAAFGVIIARLASRHRWRVLLPIGCAASALVAVLVAVATPGNAGIVQQVTSLWPMLLTLSVSFAAMVVTWSWLSTIVGVARTGSLLFLAPVSLTGLAFFERRAGSAGPSPVLWNAVLWGSVVTLVGALGVAALDRTWIRVREPDAQTARAARQVVRRLVAIAVLIAATLGTLAGAVALAAPALAARVVGTRSNGAAYEAAWTIPGAETIGAWLVFLGGLALLIAGLSNIRSMWRALATMGVAAGVAIVLVATPALDDTRLRTWTRWVPAEILQDYGTEYASLTFGDEPRTALETGLGLGLAGALLLLVAGATGSGRPGQRTDRTETGPAPDAGAVSVSETIE